MVPSTNSMMRPSFGDGRIVFVPTPPRIALFDVILDRISGLLNTHVLELGLGPGTTWPAIFWNETPS